jgi:hypothetical protein
VVFTCWRAWADRWWFYAGLVNASAASWLAVWASYETLDRQLGSRAMVPLSWGSACFLIATLISAAKAGLWKHVRNRLIELEVLRQ